MKLLLLVFVVVIMLLSTVSAYQNLYFNTTLTCNLPEVRPWCFSGYFFDLDSSSEDDPFVWFQQCTKHRSVNVQQKIVDPGDGGVLSMQGHYEIAHVIYHSCHPDNADNSDPQSPIAVCECSTTSGYQSISREVGIVHTHFSAPYASPSYQLDDPRCALPTAFANIRRGDYPTLPRFHGCDFMLPRRYNSLTGGKHEFWTSDVRYW